MNRVKQKDLFMIQVRLFRRAQTKWNLSAKECVNLFEKYDLNSYIETCYELFHVQGDEANIEDVRQYLISKGCELKNVK